MKCSSGRSAIVRAAAVACFSSAWVAVAPASTAEEANLLETDFNLSLGTFVNSSELTIRLDGESGQGSEVNWSNTFGDADVTRFRADALWRFANRHYLRLLYTDYSRSRTVVFNEEIVWGDEVFPVDLAVRGKLGFEVIELAYEYAFLKRDNFELAGTFGLHYTTFEASLGARIDSPAGGGSAEIGDKASVGAPLPVVGFRGLWHIGRSFYLEGQAQFFALSIDDYDGDVTNARAALIWQPRRFLGIGAGYDYFLVNVDVEKDQFSGSMEWEYSGPQIFFNIGF